MAVALAAALVTAALPSAASAADASAVKVVTYHGYRLVVPRAWPVFELASDGSACVRFDRHAVYLGVPSAAERCPANAIGRTEAILVSPLAPGTETPALTAGASSAGRVVNATHRVVITATWNQDPAVIRRALGVRSLSAAVRSLARRPASTVATARALMRADAKTTTPTTASLPGQVYTGLGFDACTAPSSSQMAAWGSSPYRALGVYIGGENAACSPQSGLNTAWVTQQSADGWHLVPTYVGLQAPGACGGCEAISASSASSEGLADAQTAVADAQAIGLGPGNPIYLDIEAYSRTTANTTSVLAYVQAWTQQLHAEGYASGVYSSDDSGIVDLVDNYGTGYAEPDDIWAANWNGSKSTTDANVPSTEWAAHQRIHQYQGAHNETYSGTTINIDGDYLDAATGAAGSAAGNFAAPTPAPTPSLAVTPLANGTVDLTPSWLYATGVTAWQLLAGQSPTSLAPLGPPTIVSAKLPVVTGNSFAYFAVTAMGADGEPLATSAPVATPSHLAIFGLSAFVPRVGLGGIPVGCYSTSACAGTVTTLTVGKKRLLKTGAERIPVGGGLAYFSLTAAQHKQIWLAHKHQMLVDVTEHTASGMSVTRPLMLTSFSTADPSPARSLSPSSAIKLLGTSDFVSNGWVGGILAQCVATAPCQAATTITAAGQTIAKTRSAQTLGVGEVGYLLFTLTPAGHQLIAHAPGNQLAATVKVKAGGVTATGHLALSAYN
jgi:hypothetical protein